MKAVKVQDLRVGDELTSGAKVIEKPFQFVGDQNKKLKLVIQMGEVKKLVIWGRYTTVGIKD